MIVPETVDPGSGIPMELLIPTMDVWARKTVWSQYDNCPPQGLFFRDIDWLVTKDPAQVETFQPAHDCETCRDGNKKAHAFLSEFPNRYIAMGNIEYVEYWPTGPRAVPR